MGKRKKRKGKTSWNLPEDAHKYFEPGYNKGLWEKSKVLYILICIVDVLIVVLPLIGFISLAQLIEHENANQIIVAVSVIIGMLGTCAIALGIANLWMSLLDQYLGHKFTLLCFLCGFLVCTLSLLIIYIA